MKLAQKKAEQDKKLKAAEEQRERVLAQKRREKAALESKRHEQQKTLDLAELYSNMVPVDKVNVQTGYRHHSQEWDNQVNEATAKMEDELNESAAADDARADPSRPEHYSTVDREEEYDGMLTQTGYRHHSAFWENQVNEAADRMEDELNESAAVDEAKHDPTRPEFYNTIDREEEYNGMLMQTGYRHHSAFWENQVNEAADRMEDELNESAAAQDAKQDPTRPEFYKTVNAEEEYDGMLMQRHSALWNQEVNEAADRLENEMNDASAWDEARHDPTRPEFYATEQKENVYDGIYAQLNTEGSGHSKAYMKIQEEAE